MIAQSSICRLPGIRYTLRLQRDATEIAMAPKKHYAPAQPQTHDKAQNKAQTIIVLGGGALSSCFYKMSP